MVKLYLYVHLHRHVLCQYFRVFIDYVNVYVYYKCISIYVNLCIYVYIYIYIYMCIYIYICVYILMCDGGSWRVIRVPQRAC